MCVDIIMSIQKGEPMEDVKIRVIDSDKLVNAINEGSYDVNLSSVMALGAVMLDTKKLSPAPPEEHTEKRTETHACDLISRQAAIDAIHNLYAIHGNEGSWIDQKDAFNAVNNLPPAQPEPKKGKWIKNDNGTYSCSLCHSWIPEEQHYYAQFCLHCGADMRGEPNETD